jgi:serine phosphatase RsbU (regulator of sigma subunit)
MVRDLGSKNGTLVNSTRVTEPCLLRPGDRITAGHLTLEYSDPGARFVVPQTVVFVEGNGSDSPTSSTVITSLEGLLAEGTSPKAVADSAFDAALQMKALIRAGRELAGHLPLSELFEVILNLAVEAVDATRGVLMTLEDGELEVRAAKGEGFRISTAVRDRVMSQKESLLVRDTTLDEAFKQRLSIVEQRVRSMMAVPLQTNDRVIGLIYVDCPHFIREFTKQDLNLLTVMANVAAIRIEHARLAEVEEAERAFAKDLQQAAEIQRGLLPARAPAVRGLDLAGYNVPCRTVGGDYYDFLTYADGRIGILVGDVAGKGMPAALMMSSLQARVQVLAEEPGDLGNLVSRLNRSVTTNCPDNRFVTFVICLLNPSTGELAYCNAGHNPPLIIRSCGEVDRLERGGLILGILPGATYQQSHCRLERGDILVLYSDGVTEAMAPDRDEEFGEERLAELVKQNLGKPAAELVEEVTRAVSDWIGDANPADDLTLVFARRT